MSKDPQEVNVPLASLLFEFGELNLSDLVPSSSGSSSGDITDPNLSPALSTSHHEHNIVPITSLLLEQFNTALNLSGSDSESSTEPISSPEISPNTPPLSPQIWRRIERPNSPSKHHFLSSCTRFDCVLPHKSDKLEEVSIVHKSFDDTTTKSPKTRKFASLNLRRKQFKHNHSLASFLDKFSPPSSSVDKKELSMSPTKNNSSRNSEDKAQMKGSWSKSNDFAFILSRLSKDSGLQETSQLPSSHLSSTSTYISEPITIKLDESVPSPVSGSVSPTGSVQEPVLPTGRSYGDQATPVELNNQKVVGLSLDKKSYRYSRDVLDEDLPYAAQLLEQRLRSFTLTIPKWELFDEEFEQLLQVYGELVARCPEVQAYLRLPLESLAKQQSANIEFIQRIYKGRFSNIWKANFNGDTVAIKQIHLIFAEDTEAMKKQYEIEYKRMQSLEHPNIIEYYDFFMSEDETKLNLVMEFVDSGSLRMMLNKQGPCMERVATKLINQVLLALAHLNDYNQTYPGLRLENILVTRMGIVKLIEFGDVLENYLKNPEDENSTHYLAPELIKNGISAYCPKTDIWVIGCCLVELLTGTAPLSHCGGTSIFNSEIEVIPVPNLFSGDCEDFIRQCWQLNPENRPNAKELLTHRFLNTSVDDRIPAVVNILRKSQRTQSFSFLNINRYDH